MAENNHELEISRVFSAAVETVFDAWLDVEGIKQWMCPGEGVNVPNPIIDAKEGGAFDFTMAVGDQNLPHTGTYKIIDRPRKLQFTWLSPGTQGIETVVTLNFESLSDNETRLTLSHAFLPDQQESDNHKGGWIRILECLDKELSAIEAQ
ncbi:MAG: SRPBCC domain-containing protein [Acidiferrobacterales bacterium]